MVSHSVEGWTRATLVASSKVGRYISMSASHINELCSGIETRVVRDCIAGTRIETFGKVWVPCNESAESKEKKIHEEIHDFCDM